MTAFHGRSRTDFVFALALQNLLWGGCNRWPAPSPTAPARCGSCTGGPALYAVSVAAMA
jgi:hypothetical protein